MATQAEQEESHAQSRTDLSSPSPESSLSWCLVQLNKSSPRLDALPGDDPRPSREADKRLRAGQWRALVAIRTHHIKGGSSRIGRYQAQGGLPPLLTILRRPESSRKVLDLTLSILANCCTEKETRGEVRGSEHTLRCNSLSCKRCILYWTTKCIKISFKVNPSSRSEFSCSFLSRCTGWVEFLSLVSLSNITLHLYTQRSNSWSKRPLGFTLISLHCVWSLCICY